jgi:hypothetical protein
LFCKKGAFVRPGAKVVVRRAAAERVCCRPTVE